MFCWDIRSILWIKIFYINFCWWGRENIITVSDWCICFISLNFHEQFYWIEIDLVFFVLNYCKMFVFWETIKLNKNFIVKPITINSTFYHIIIFFHFLLYHVIHLDFSKKKRDCLWSWILRYTIFNKLRLGLLLCIFVSPLFGSFSFALGNFLCDFSTL